MQVRADLLRIVQVLQNFCAYRAGIRTLATRVNTFSSLCAFQPSTYTEMCRLFARAALTGTMTLSYSALSTLLPIWNPLGIFDTSNAGTKRLISQVLAHSLGYRTGNKLAGETKKNQAKLTPDAPKL